MTRRPAPRGQAVVELTVLMIVMIPVIFYSLFLDDLLRHRLDLLESVVSSPWDYAAIDQQDSKGANLTNSEQLSWCDHTLIYNSYDNGYECDNDVHHKAFTAHVCWVVEGGQQVTCNTDQSVAKVDDNADYNGGGMTTCSARAGVFNYFIINQAFGGSFTQVKITDTEHMKGSAHSHYGAAAANIFMLEKQQFAILHDDWAMKTPDDIDASFDILPDLGGLLGGGATFKSRVKKVYDDNAKFDDANDFFDKIKDDKLIDEGAKDDGMGDDPSTLHMSFNKEPGHGFGLIKQHTSSAYSDSRVSGTHSSRADFYFGQPEGDW